MVLKLDYSVAQRPHMYPPDAQNSTFLVPDLDPMSIACYALSHTSAYHILKESIMFAESRPNTNLLRFHARSSENVKSSLCIANFQLKLKMFCCRGPETCKKQKIICGGI